MSNHFKNKNIIFLSKKNIELTTNLEIPIIVINWNGIQDTLECVESVLNLSNDNYRIYLIDNNSTDSSAIKLKDQYLDHPKINLVFNKSNLGFTKATNNVLRNLLKSQPIPPYVALLNNDTAVHKDWLFHLINAAKEQNASIVSSKMIDYQDHNKLDNAGHFMLNTGEILPIGHGQHPSNFNQSFENWGACAGAGLYSLEMLQEIGVFDEYFQTGYEDAELGARAILAGYKCVYEPKAVVFHKMGSSIKKIFDYNYALSIQKNVLYTYFKLIPSGVIIFNSVFFVFRYLLIILIQLLFLRIQHSKLLIQALWEVLVIERKVVLKSRKEFKSLTKLGNFQTGRKQTFFLWNNLLRFYHYFIQKKPSALEAYGKKD